MATRKRQLICYTTESVFQAARVLARNQNRSVSNLIEQLILDAAEKRQPRASADETESRARNLLGD